MQVTHRRPRRLAKSCLYRSLQPGKDEVLSQKTHCFAQEELAASGASAAERVCDGPRRTLCAPDQTCRSKATCQRHTGRGTWHQVARGFQHLMFPDIASSNGSELSCFAEAKPCSSITNTPSRRFAADACCGTAVSRVGTPRGSLRPGRPPRAFTGQKPVSHLVQRTHFSLPLQ